MKKLMMCLLVGIILLGMTACGSNTIAKDDAAAATKVSAANITEDVKAQFKNSVFMGDSITEGFAINEILPRESVIAGAGTTAGFIYEDLDMLVEKKPDNVFIMLGLMDILMPVDDPKELFRNDLTKLINKIKEDLPDCKVYLQSIPPVTQDTLKAEPRYEGLEEYNGILKEVADKLSVNYIDIRELAQETPDLYAEDGIYFKKGVYQLWLMKLSESLY